MLTVVFKNNSKPLLMSFETVERQMEVASNLQRQMVRVSDTGESAIAYVGKNTFLVDEIVAVVVD